jgi:hypothetical protein
LAEKDMKPEFYQNYIGWDIANEPYVPEAADHDRIFGNPGAPPFDWREFTPRKEDQKRTVFCTSFSYLNCCETKYKKETGEEINFSDRCLGVEAKTNHNGNTFYQVATIALKKGLIKEELCTWKDKWLERPNTYWDEIFNLPDFDSLVRRYPAPNFSKVGVDPHNGIEPHKMSNALAFSPLWIGIGVGRGYNQEVVTPPSKYLTYHAVEMTYMDDDYYYIYDSVMPEEKKLRRDYPILYAYSLRDLPESWKIKNMLPLDLVRKKGTDEVYVCWNGKRYWVTPAAMLEGFYQMGVVKGWDDIKQTDHLEDYGPLAGVWGDLSLSGWIQYKTSIK